ncbi:hypothetical protein Tco_0912004 [Tanacetum coccineum]
MSPSYSPHTHKPTRTRWQSHKCLLDTEWDKYINGKRISEKRTKNQVKTNKTEHRMEKHGKVKVKTEAIIKEDFNGPTLTHLMGRGQEIKGQDHGDWAPSKIDGQDLLWALSHTTSTRLEFSQQRNTMKKKTSRERGQDLAREHDGNKIERSGYMSPPIRRKYQNSVAFATGCKKIKKYRRVNRKIHVALMALSPEFQEHFKGTKRQKKSQWNDQGNATLEDEDEVERNEVDSNLESTASSKPVWEKTTKADRDRASYHCPWCSK